MGVEETYPLPSDAPVTLLLTSSNAAQIAFTFGTESLLEMQDSCGTIVAPARVFLFSLAFFGCLLPVWFYNGRQNRRLAEGEAPTTAAGSTRQPVNSPGHMTPTGEYITFASDA